MEENLTDNASQENQKSFWTQSEKAKLSQILSIICVAQKAYGRVVEVKPIYDYFKLKLEGKFTADQVIWALDRYTDRKNDIPAPADVINILQPEPRKITIAEYIAAKDQIKRGGYYNPHSIEAYTIRKYEAQAEQDLEESTPLISQRAHLKKLGWSPETA